MFILDFEGSTRANVDAIFETAGLNIEMDKHPN